METTEPTGAKTRRRFVVATVGTVAIVGAAWTLWTRDDAPSTDVASTRGPSPSTATHGVSRTTKDGRPIVLVMVVARSGGAPIAGAQVVVHPRADAAKTSTISTDAAGVAAVAMPDGPEAELLVQASGFGDDRRTIERDSEDVIVSLARAESPGTVSVRVTSPAPRDVRISVDHGDVSTGATARFERVRPGRRNVTTSGGDRENGWEISGDIDVVSGRDVAVDLAFDAAARVTGRVLDVEGRAVAGCIVEFTSWSEAPPANRRSWGRTDAGGAFAVDGFSADHGTLRVGLPQSPSTTHVQRQDGTWVSTAGDKDREVEWVPSRQEQRGGALVAVAAIGGIHYLPQEFPNATPGGPAIRATLHRAARLVGRLTSAPPGGGTLILQAVQDDTSAVPAKFDARGEFSCPTPVVGEALRLWLTVDGFAPTAVDAPAVETDETHDLGETALSTGSAIDVALVDADGAPCAFRRLDVLAPWPHCTEDIADDEGHVKIEHVPRSQMRLAFAAADGSPRTILAIDDPASAPTKFVLGRGATVSGRVVDARGAPAAGVEVSFHLAALDGDEKEDASGCVTTRTDGSYTIALQSGRLRVAVFEGIRRLDVGDVEITVVDGDTRTLDLRER